jgi:ankyrin repeat protein
MATTSTQALPELLMNKAKESWYALRNAVYAKDFDAAAKLLTEEPDLLRATNGIGETVLHFLAVEDDLEGVAWLHSHGADITTKNEFGTPALFEVASLGYQDLFYWFVAHGADVNARDQYDANLMTYLNELHDEEITGWIMAAILNAPGKHQ